jgi:hypothetical protein
MASMFQGAHLPVWKLEEWARDLVIVEMFEAGGRLGI